jgi:RNA polymerase sigma-70 factor (ECF subfamily)
MAMPSRNGDEAMVTPPEERQSVQAGGLRTAAEVPAADSLQARESQLIAQTVQGDRESFYDLVRPYERAVFLTALSLVKDPSDAEDVAQDAILKAFKNLSHFRQESKFSTWLIQITLNEARMRLRKDRKHLYESLNDNQQEDGESYIPRDFADWRPIPSEVLEQTELREALNNALQRLAPKYRAVLSLRDIQHLTIKETAELLGLTITTVKTRLLRARLRLRDALAPGFDGAWAQARAYDNVRPL